MTLSIIIPVYNTEASLPVCIDSILSQSFTDFELLLVDDGSKDGSRAVCDRYAEKDSRVRVFHQENGGCGSARNVGLDHASGEWVYFVDSDDEVLPGGLQTLLDCIREDVDIVMAGFERSDENGAIIYRVEDRVITLFGIWIRYHKLLARMRKHGISDDGLRRKMESIVKKELKFGFFDRKKLRKIKRIMQGWCSERKICRLCRTAA